MAEENPSSYSMDIGSDSKPAPYKLTNQQVLIVTTILFGGFVAAEIVGALASNSLSLLGDAAAMMVDVFTVRNPSKFHHIMISILFLVFLQHVRGKSEGEVRNSR